MKHVLIAWMEDMPGVLNRIANLFRRRKFNIESMAAGHSEVPGITRMTIVVDEDKTDVDQVVRQLYKIVNIIEIVDVTGKSLVQRELALIKVRVNAETRREVMQLVDIYRAKIVDVAQDSLMVEVTGPEDRVESLITLMSHFGIEEMVRTGRVVVVRGADQIEEMTTPPPAASKPV